MDWQTMKSAPKDDSLHNILVVCVSGSRRYVDAAFWDEDDKCWYSATNHDGYVHAELKPIFWSEYPAPPTT